MLVTVLQLLCVCSRNEQIHENTGDNDSQFLTVEEKQLQIMKRGKLEKKEGS